MVTTEEYLEIQEKIRQICLKYGMEERNTTFEHQFHLKSNIANIFGEVIRLFPFDINRHECVAFFNKLQKTSISTEYDYLYEKEFDLIPNKYPEKHQNLIPLDLFTSDKKELAYEEIEYIIKDAIKQLKELESAILKQRIENDFN